MYKCLDCGYEFDEDDVFEWNETHGFDTPPYEHWTGCPICKGAYEEAVECNGCGKMFCESEIIDGFCEKCMEKIENE